MKYWLILNVCDLTSLPGWNEKIPANFRPSLVYWSREDAEREMLRLANSTDGEFILFESVATAVKHGDGELSAHVVEEIVK